jgi:hypothetical protein
MCFQQPLCHKAHGAAVCWCCGGPLLTLRLYAGDVGQSMLAQETYSHTLTTCCHQHVCVGIMCVGSMWMLGCVRHRQASPHAVQPASCSLAHTYQVCGRCCRAVSSDSSPCQGRVVECWSLWCLVVSAASGSVQYVAWFACVLVHTCTWCVLSTRLVLVHAGTVAPAAVSHCSQGLLLGGVMQHFIIPSRIAL